MSALAVKRAEHAQRVHRRLRVLKNTLVTIGVVIAVLMWAVAPISMLLGFSDQVAYIVGMIIGDTDLDRSEFSRVMREGYRYLGLFLCISPFGFASMLSFVYLLGEVILQRWGEPPFDHSEYKDRPGPITEESSEPTEPEYDGDQSSRPPEHYFRF